MCTVANPISVMNYVMGKSYYCYRPHYKMGVAWDIFFRYLIKPQNDRHSNDCYVQVKCFYDGCVVGGVALSDPA